MIERVEATAAERYHLLISHFFFHLIERFSINNRCLYLNDFILSSNFYVLFSLISYLFDFLLTAMVRMSQNAYRNLFVYGEQLS